VLLIDIIVSFGLSPAIYAGEFLSTPPIIGDSIAGEPSPIKIYSIKASIKLADPTHLYLFR